MVTKGQKRVSGRSFNTKEPIDDKFGTPTPIPFGVVDFEIGLDTYKTAEVVSFCPTPPLLFYT